MGLISAGWDPGRLNNKLYLEDKKLINMNAICSGYERRVLKKEEGNLENYLDVEVFRGDEYLGRYFVGRMAYNYNRGDLRWSANGVPKFSEVNSSYDEIIKMVTNLAFSQYDPNNPKKKVQFCLGTGSPTEEYFEAPEVLEVFKEMMKVPYKVVFKHELFNNAEIEVVVPKMYFKPEGTASLISMTYNDNLSISKIAKDIFDKGYKVIGMNIGSSTTDIAIMKPDMEFDENGFFGIDVGSSKALNEIRAILYKGYGYDTTKLKVDYLIRNYTKVRYKGEIIDLNEIKKRPFENLIALLKTKFYDEVERRGIDIGEAGALFISGGTVVLIEDKLNEFIHGVPSKFSTDPLFEDARGYFLEAKTQQLLEAASEKEIFENDEDKIYVVS
ncbi:MAG: plasmid segregation protein ParM [Candidatus Petromonas sp.]|jgi:hypothetical protein|nr:plasmid segregation protein ParM [Candidatus Petromonas sp.]